MNYKARRVFNWAIAVAVLSVGSGLCQTSVITQHNDNGRTGQNINETILTPANVNSAQFGKLFSYQVDGNVFAQPLYLPSVAISGKGSHNVVFVATEHDTVYAFDADSNGGANNAPLWRASLLDPAYGAAPGATPSTTDGLTADITPEIGITGTPVIDPVAGILYAVSLTLENSTYVQRLHALDVTTGTEKFGQPTVIRASVPGTGSGSVSGVLAFDPKWENQRPGLLLMNGVVYIGYSAHGDNGPWHGWILAYNASTLQQVGVYCSSPNGLGAGVWMAGAGLAGEVPDPVNHPFGRMFLSTGNGSLGATKPYSNQMSYGEADLSLDLTNGQASVTDQFTPSNAATLNSSDGDVGSGGVLILPTQPGNHPNLLIQIGKSGSIFVLDRENLGGTGSTDNIVQEIGGQTKGLWSVPAYWNNNVYVWGTQDSLKAFPLNNGVLGSVPSSQSAQIYKYPGATVSVSANGTTNGIVWSVQTDGYNNGSPAILQAWDALNVARQLYSSDQNPARDTAGPAVKFAVPTVANGKVYVGTSGTLEVFGLLAGIQQANAPVMTPGGSTISGPVSVSISDTTPGSFIYVTLDGSAPTTNSNQYTGPISVTGTTTVRAIATATGYLQSPVATAVYKLSNQSDAPVLSPAGGTYNSNQLVTITDTTAGAQIYYTLDGSTPDSTSTLYSGPIPVTSQTTIRAIAIANGFINSPIAVASYLIQQGGIVVNFGQGFSTAQSTMSFNGTTGLDDTRLQLTNGGRNQAGSAFYKTLLPIQSFTTDFTFQLSNPVADGITFTIQGSKSTALGSSGSGLGYQSIPKSVAIKFDLYGSNPSTTGLFLNGAAPATPEINLATAGINLHSGDTMTVHLTYDGTTLAMTMTDTVTSRVFSTSWLINIPSVVGGNSAYVGFTGGTGGSTSSQKIETWTFGSGAGASSPPTATPVFSPIGGTFSNPQVLTITDATPGAVIYYTTDGTTPTGSSSVYGGSILVSVSETIQAIAIASGYSASATASAPFTIVPGSNTGGPSPSYGAGFTASGLTLNGGADVINGSLQLTDGGIQEARSAFFASPVSIQSFVTSFNFQLQNASAEGFAFVIQSQGVTALGGPGGNLGYAADSGGPGVAISKSVALKFDLANTSGEGSDSIGVYLAGAPPTLPAQDLTLSGIDLHSGHVFRADIVYDGTNLIVTLTDTVTTTAFAKAFPVNVPGIVGGSTAYVGFTAATGGLSAIQSILSWTFTSGLGPNFPNGFSSSGLTLNGATVGSSILQLTNGKLQQRTSAFFNTPVPVQGFNTDFTFQLLNAGGDGFTFVVQSQGPKALGSSGAGLGYGQTGTGAYISNSVALKFDLYSNAGESSNSTGIYINGALPTNPATDMTPSGINLHNGHVFQAHVAYDGKNLALTLTDTATGAKFTQAFPVNIPAAVGGNTAYIGFTAGTGGATSTQNILAWTYTASVLPASNTAFSSPGVTLNGSAKILNGLLQLTDGGANEAGSAFVATPVSDSRFTTDFDFQLLSPTADGFTFVLQGKGATALGSSGNSLGYGPSTTGITKSVALAFDLYGNTGNGNSVGVYTKGASPTTGAVSLAGTGVNLHSGDILHAHVVYDGTNLSLTLSDSKIGASFSQAFPVNIAAAVGAPTAYVGFTGGTGGSTATQNILNWTFSTGP